MRKTTTIEEITYQINQTSNLDLIAFLVIFIIGVLYVFILISMKKRIENGDE